MKHRRLIILLSIPAVLLVLGILVAGWLLNSDAGSHWVVTRVIDAMDGKLSIVNMEGSLGESLSFSGIRFTHDGLDVEINRMEATAGLSLLPPRINIVSLEASGLTIQQTGFEAGTEKSPASLENTLAGLDLPIGISAEDVTLWNLDVLDGGQEIVLHVDRISLAGHWKDDIEVRQLDISSPLFTTGLHGRIALTTPFDHQWHVEGSLINPWIPSASSEIKLDLAGDANSTRVHFNNQSPGLDMSGVITKPFGKALLNIEFSADRYIWPGDGTTTDIQISGLSGKVVGPLDDYRLSLQALLATVELPAVQLALVGQGNLESLSVDRLDARSDFLDASVTGVMEWAGTGVFDLDIEILRLVPAVWLPDWPADQFIHGRVAFRSDGSLIHVPAISLKLSGTDMQVNGDGVFDPQVGIVDARLSWQQLYWPPSPGATEFSSASGRLLVSGSPGSWRFEGELQFDTSEYPGGFFELEGSGGKYSAEIHIGRGNALGGSLTGRARLDWSEALWWSAELDVEQLDLGVLSSDWPARLDTQISLLHNTGDEQLQLWFESLSGVFRGQPLDAVGGLEFDPSGTRFKDIHLHSGGSEISLDGALQDPEGLAFILDVQGPGWMADILGGDVSGRGRFAPGALKPILDLAIEARNLEWGATRIESLVASTDHGSDGKDPWVNLQLQNIQYGNFELQSAQAFLSGDRNHQQLQVKLTEPAYELEAQFTGTVSDWAKLIEGGWSGQISGLTLSTRQQLLMNLREPVAFTVSNKGGTLGSACFDAAESGGLCLESRWRPDGQFDFSASLSELSLGLSQLVYDHEIEFTQRLDGELRWAHEPGKLPSGRAAIKISRGRFGDEQDESEHVTTAEGFFGFEISEGNLTAGQFDIPFPGVGKIDLDYAVSGLALDGTGKVSGQFSVELDDISVLGELLPGLERIDGRLDTSLQISGVTLDPKLDGFVSLQDFEADIPYVGTQLRQVRLHGKVSGSDEVSLQGEFKAGEGFGEINITSEFSDWTAPSLEVMLTGSSLRLLNTPELRMDADADLVFGWSGGAWSVDGVVGVQQARITPLTFIVNRVTESADVRIVSGELPYAEVTEPQKPIRLSGGLKIDIGDDVQIDTDAVKAKLDGGVDLAWGGDLMPVANGSILVNGQISVFGPVLHVVDGQVRFPGIPVNNPVLDIRAERDIFGNTQIRTAGVGITGTAKRPVIETYTDPQTNESRAWALLITGSDVDYGQGIGAFEVGTYIAPKLYLSYGISLFDNDNIVGARYDLKKGFGVKASSGQRESGIDMSYTIDR